MSDSFESIFLANMDFYMDDLFTCIPAQVVGIQKLKDGLIDVQPLVNKIYGDGTRTEYPVIYSVPVIMPSTLTSSVTMPVSQGDTVLLVFAQKDLDTFKNGADTPHDPSSFRTFNMNDAQAIIGLSTVNKTKLNPENHNRGFDLTSLIIAHNVGTDRETFIKLSNDGSVLIDSSKDFTLLAKDVNVKCTNINIQTTNFKINSTSFDIVSANTSITGNLAVKGSTSFSGSVTIDGMNLNNFMKSHKHAYTDDGRPMITNIPQGF